MNILNLDFFLFKGVFSFLSNAVFVTLFLSMALYWTETAFFNQYNLVLSPNGTPSPLRGGEGPSTSAPEANNNKLNISLLFSKIKTFFLLSFNSFSAKNIMTTANILLVFLLLVRWKESGHFPLSNLYESFLFLAWCCTFLHLVLCRTFSNFIEKILGSIIAPCALLMDAFANFTLPKEMQVGTSLVPALQSNWLMMHVTVMIISYGTLIVGSLLSIAFLILNKMSSKNVNGDLLKSLDDLSYRIIGLGFPFLTIGILSGAVWANEAWGSYWSWDPKETWALLTWLVFAIYLHTRLNLNASESDVAIQQKGTANIKGQSEKPAIIASIGFIVVWFCYLGVNLIGEGLHSYGFFKG